MKRVFIILCALITLASCSKEVLPGTDPVQNTDPVVAQSTEIPVNVTVTLGDLVPDTKARIKKGWADGDVIFLFLRGVAAPKYAKLIYDAAGKTWSGSLENELSLMEIAALTEKVLTAVYMPFGSTAKVDADGTDFTFVDVEGNPFNYTGYFFLNEAVDYSLGKGLDINLNLPAFVPSTAGDALIHFDISGFTSGNLFTFKQAHIKPLSVTGVSAAGSVQTTEGAKGGLINGYEYQSMVSFSGILDASAVGNSVEYNFSIDDTTADVIYSRNVGKKTIPCAQYIGIGDISSASVWTATPYVEMGDGLKWAKSNLGAASETAAGNFYAWGETATKNNYSWSTYVHYEGTNDQGYGVTKYTFADAVYSGRWYSNGWDNKKTLAGYDYVDDAARQNLKGGWRIPTEGEWTALRSTANFTWSWDSTGATVTSKVEGYKGNKIFLPAAGYMNGGNLAFSSGNNRRGCYWSSSLGNKSTLGSRIRFNKGNSSSPVNFNTVPEARCYGYSIRAVIEQ